VCRSSNADEGVRASSINRWASDGIDFGKGYLAKPWATTLRFWHQSTRGAVKDNWSFRGGLLPANSEGGSSPPNDQGEFDKFCDAYLRFPNQSGVSKAGRLK
jgi:hypothetical protein